MISRIGSPRYAVSGPSGQEKPTLDAGSSRWYIAECKPTRERTLRSSLEKVGYEAYVASRKETHVYKSRNRRTVEQIVIPGKVFVRTERANLMNILLLFSSVYRFQIDKSAASRLPANRLTPPMSQRARCAACNTSSSKAPIPCTSRRSPFVWRKK